MNYITFDEIGARARNGHCPKAEVCYAVYTAGRKSKKETKGRTICGQSVSITGVSAPEVSVLVSWNVPFTGVGPIYIVNYSRVWRITQIKKANQRRSSAKGVSRVEPNDRMKNPDGWEIPMRGWPGSSECQLH